MNRWVLLVPLALLLAGGVASAQDATPPPTGIRYGKFVYNPDPGDGPIVVFVDKVILTEAGTVLEGVVTVQQGDAWQAVPFSGASVPDVEILPGDILVPRKVVD